MIKNQNFGFTIFLALIVISSILAVGLGVFDIVFREMRLSGLGEESQLAFYAADTGIECALYWDRKFPGFSKSVFMDPAASHDVLCNSVDITDSDWNFLVVPFISTTTNFKLRLANNSCVEVTVIKNEGGFDQIKSYGYNIDCESISPDKVRRGLMVTF